MALPHQHIFFLPKSQFIEDRFMLGIMYPLQDFSFSFFFLL
ncbi:MAG TPA: hypothetical protein VJG49_03970 [Candidatus Nanoarchaeia archaeon]|nr:hypothetical protein [Candidatus Nanoarchaeia archaeon]